MRPIIFAAACFAAAPATAQPAPDLSAVAGYKAAFTCSAHFNAGRTVEQISGDELNRIYPDYREALAALPAAMIDEEGKTVSVAYADGAPPRLVKWRPLLGCVQAPAMAGEEAFEGLIAVKSRIAAKRAEPAAIDLPSAGFANASLDAVIADAFDRATYGEGTETSAVLVLRGDKMTERYREGFDAFTPQRTWSVAKSIAATVIGAAVQDGMIDTAEATGLAAWATPGDPRGAITFDNLLRMASGLDSGPAGNRTDDIYFGGGRVVDHAITHRLAAEPGSRFVYANNDTMTAMRALRERFRNDRDYVSFPYEKLLGPLGMRHTFLETDWNNDFVLSSQVWTTARDLARLGQLYLNDGVWNGARILPEDWTRYVSTPSGPQPQSRRAGDQRPGYGAQFWLFGDRHGLPEGTYAAQGNRGQYLVIIPAHDIIIVRRGFDDGGGFDIAKFSADIIEAIGVSEN